MPGTGLVQGAEALLQELAEAFALGRSEGQKLEPEFLSILPPNERLLDPERPLIVRHEEPYLDRDSLLQFAGALDATARFRDIEDCALAFDILPIGKKRPKIGIRPVVDTVLEATL